MPRRLSLPSPELIRIELYFIYSYNGTWEEQWKPLQGAIDIPVVSKEIVDHALHGWTHPLVNELGPPPEGMLRKLPSEHCANGSNCTFYDVSRCKVLSKKMPWCFEPKGITPGNLATEVIQLWKTGVYVLIVESEHRG